jgi:hypothetical protein
MGVPSACYETGMTKHAAAILHLAPSRVRDRFPAADGDDVRVAANGEDVALAALEDATVVHLGVSIGAEPEQLAERMRALLADLLDAHEEPRGVPVYPSSYELQATTWAAAIEELGEAADWVEVREEDSAGGMAGLLGAFGIDPGSLGAFGIDPKQLEALEGTLGGIDQEKLMSSAMRMAEAMARSGALDDLAKRMHVFGPKDGEDPRRDLEREDAGEERCKDLGFDVQALAEQARELLAADPDLEARLRSAVGEAVEGHEAVELDAIDVTSPAKPSTDE